MPLKDELSLRKPIALQGHEALLSTYYTASQLKKRACELLQSFGLTDVQFNLMMLLQHQSGSEGGLSQVQLSDMMLVNSANISSLIDRMEKAKLVVRTAKPFDRRCKIIRLTTQGRRLLDKIEPLYAAEIRKIMSVLKETEQKKLVKMLEKIRKSISG